MGLIRKAIIVGGILFALPSPPQGESPGVGEAFATLSAAGETLADVQSFCDRRAQACVTGLYLFEVIKGKAQYSTKLLYEWASAETAQPAEKKKTAKKVPKDEPKLRLATINPDKPQSIEDLLKDSVD